MEFAGWVALAIVVLILGYLLPAAIRSRQVVVDSRVADRFSEDLRVLATAGTSPTPQEQTSRGYLHRPRTESTEDTMHSPAPQRLAAADARRAAAARATRAAAASRRAAAAARRLVLTLVLLAATAAAWVLVAVASAPLALAIVPSVLFLTVLVLGRRAAAQAKIADARLAEEIERARSADQARATRVAATKAAREAEAPESKSSLRIDVDPTRLLEEDASATAVLDLPEGEGWTPVPVPAPMYTMKASAPRREVEPLAPEAIAAQSVASAEDDGGAPASADSSPSAGVEVAPNASAEAPVAAPAAPSVNLEAVLDRRRAVGE